MDGGTFVNASEMVRRLCLARTPDFFSILQEGEVTWQRNMFTISATVKPRVRRT